MAISNDDYNRLELLLLNAFPTYDSLKRMLMHQLGESLEAMVGRDDLNTVVYRLVREWAIPQGKVSELVAGAMRENPGNPGLQEFSTALASSTYRLPGERSKQAVVDGLEAIHEERRVARQQIMALTGPISLHHALPALQLSPFLYLENFLGRKDELMLLDDYWGNNERFILIYGLAGIGKSSLVSYFLENKLKQEEFLVIRHDFRLSPSFSSLARSLVIPFNMPIPPSDDPQTNVAELIALLAGMRCVLFFDNFEEALWVDQLEASQARSRPLKVQDPWLEQFLSGILLRQGQARIFITSRYRPDFGAAGVRMKEVPESGGLSGLLEAESRQLLDLYKGRQQLSEDSWELIYQHLVGHPAAIELLGQILRDEIYTPEELIGRIGELQQQYVATPFLECVAEDFLEALYAELGAAEKTCLLRASVLRIPFDVSALAALTFLPLSQVKATADILWRKSLLERQASGFSYHPLVQTYLLGRLSPAERHVAHLNAGEYYTLLDLAQRPWQNLSDVSFALESAYHLEFIDTDNSLSILEEVFVFLNSKGFQYYLEGDFLQSERFVRQQIAQIPNFENRPIFYWQRLGVLHFYLGNLLLKQKRFDEARDAYAAAVTYAPAVVRIWQAWGVLEGQVGNLEEARRLFAKAAEVDDRHVPVWQAWGVLEGQAGNLEEARRLFAKAAEVDDRHVQVWQAWGVLEGQAGNLEEARRLFVKAIKLDARSVQALQELARLDGKVGNLAAAREWFIKATLVRPDDPMTWQAWGVMESKAENFQLALQYLHRALEINPKDPVTLQSLAIAYENSGKLDEARKYFKIATELAPVNYKIWGAWGRAELRYRNNEAAKQYLEKAVLLNPKDALAWAYLGEAKQFLNDIEGAESCYLTALSFPNDPKKNSRTYFEYGKMLSRIPGRSRDAEKYYLAAIQSGGDSPFVHAKLGELYYWLGDYPSSEKHYRLVLSMQPSNTYVMTSLASLLARIPGRDQDAEYYFRKSLELQENDARTHGFYANFLAYREQYNEAQSHFLRSLELKEDGRVRAQYRRIFEP